MRAFTNSFLLAGLLLVLAACGGESQLPVATGKGRISAINTIVTAPTIGVFIEQRAIGSATYSAAMASVPYDDLDYTFHFAAQLTPGAAPKRIASTDLSVVRDTAYTFVISGSLDSPDITVWESPVVTPAEGTTTADVQFGHTSPASGDYDVYLLDAAIAPAVGNESASLSFGQVTPSVSVDAGTYVLTLTAPGDPGTVLYQSEPFDIAAGSVLLITAFDATPNQLTDVLVRVFNRTSGATQTIIPAGVPAKIRYFHTAYDAGNVDIYFDDPLTTPVIADQAFGDISPEIDVPADGFALTYTQANNIGNILVATSEPTIPGGLRTDLYLIDQAGGTPTILSYPLDRRGIETAAAVTVFNTALNEGPIDFYAVPSGEAIDTATPRAVYQLFGAPPARFELAAGAWDLYATVTTEKTVLAGPVAVDLALGDVVQTIVYQTADPSAVDLVVVPGT